LRLIAIAQNGLPVSTASLKQYTELPLPVFGPQAKALAAKLQSSGGSQHSAAIAAIASGALAGPGTAPHQAPPATPAAGPGHHLNLPGSHALQPNMGASPMGGSLVATPQAAPTPSATIDPYTMTAEERANYLVHFASADRDRDSFVSGQEAFEFFMQSGLDAVTLRGIWLLADVGSDGKLDQEEFSVAMHLVWKVRGGLPLPTALPAVLQPGAPRLPAAVLAAARNGQLVTPAATPASAAIVNVPPPASPVPPSLNRPQSLAISGGSPSPLAANTPSAGGSVSLSVPRRGSFSSSPAAATTPTPPAMPAASPQSTSSQPGGSDFLNFPAFDTTGSDPVLSIDGPAPAKTAAARSSPGFGGSSSALAPPSLSLEVKPPTGSPLPTSSAKDDFAAFDAFGAGPTTPTPPKPATPSPGGSAGTNPLDAGLDMSMFGGPLLTPPTPTPIATPAAPKVSPPPSTSGHGTGSSLFGNGAADALFAASPAHPPAHPPSHHTPSSGHTAHSYAPTPLSNSMGNIHARRSSGSAAASSAAMIALSAQVDQAARDKEESQRRLQAANAALEASSAQLAILKDRLEDYKKQTALNNQKIEFTLQRQRDIEEQTHEFQTLVEEQDHALADERERARVIDEQVATTRRQLEVMSETLSTRKAEITAAKASTEVLKREHQDAERSLALLENEVEHLRASIQSTEVIKSGKATLLGSRKETETELKRQKEELTITLTNLQAELKAQQAEIETLRATQPAKQAEKSALEKQIKEAQQQLWEAKQQSNSLRAANEAAAAVAAAAAAVPLVAPKSTSPPATTPAATPKVEIKTPAAAPTTAPNAFDFDATPGSSDPFGADLFASSPPPPKVATPAPAPAASSPPVAAAPSTPVAAPVTVTSPPVAPAKVAAPTPVIPAAAASAASPSGGGLDEFEWEELDPSIVGKGSSTNGGSAAANTTHVAPTVVSQPAASTPLSNQGKAITPPTSNPGESVPSLEPL
jgi:septal ring factor EnvC (AmiA/AmiB activator)